MRRRSLLQAALAAPAAFPLPAMGADTRVLTMGVATAPTSLDPHYHDAFTSTQALLQIYGQLRVQDPSSAVGPGLAISCVPAGDAAWDLVLRPGIRFHDGTPFEAEDIAFSFARVRSLQPALSSFAANVRDVAGIDVLDPLHVRIRLNNPDPLFEYKLGQVCMLSRKLHANAITADFTAGRAAIGTGAYKLVRYVAGERMELEANPEFWGGKPGWDRVTIRYIGDPGARMAALLSGDVDLIDGLGVEQIETLKAEKAMSIFGSPSFLILYLGLDTVRAQSPYIAGPNGQPLPTNPLADVRVRRALSLSLNRAALVDRLLQGHGSAADQLPGPAAPDRIAGLSSLLSDVAAARQLLADAGYKDGFQMTLHGTGGYFAGDSAVLQAVGQSFGRIGVRTQVEPLPISIYSTRLANRDSSIYLGAFNGAYALIALRYLAMTPDPASGNGTSNRLGYSNPALDRAMADALRTMDPARRKALTDAAGTMLMDDLGFIPIYHGQNNWAGRAARVRYQANPMGRTSAFMAHPAA